MEKQKVCSDGSSIYIYCGPVCMWEKDADYTVDGGNEDGGSIQSQYGIPESCDTTFDIGSTGLKKIQLTDSDITVPDTGAMYTAPVKMKEIDSEYRKALVEKLFDTDKGVSCLL